MLHSPFLTLSLNPLSEKCDKTSRLWSFEWYQVSVIPAAAWSLYILAKGTCPAQLESGCQPVDLQWSSIFFGNRLPCSGPWKFHYTMKILIYRFCLPFSPTWGNHNRNCSLCDEPIFAHPWWGDINVLFQSAKKNNKSRHGWRKVLVCFKYTTSSWSFWENPAKILS